MRNLRAGWKGPGAARPPLAPPGGSSLRRAASRMRSSGSAHSIQNEPRAVPLPPPNPQLRDRSGGNGGGGRNAELGSVLPPPERL